MADQLKLNMKTAEEPYQGTDCPAIGIAEAQILREDALRASVVVTANIGGGRPA